MSTNADRSDAGPIAGQGETAEYTHREVLVILSGLAFGILLAALDQTIVSTSIRTIGDDLQGLSMQAWVQTSYLITATISTPIYGKLGDLFGRKKLFLFAISLFIVASAACSFATSMPQLSVFRAIQGLGAGGLFSLALAIIGDIVAPRERARYTGYFMAVFATSSVVGPVVGGFFAGQESLLGVTGWRWVFLVNVPIGLVALAVVARTLTEAETRAGRVRIDWTGAALLAVGLVPLLVLAEQGREWGWSDPRSLAAMVIGAVGLAGFIAAERRAGDAALIPLKIFRIRSAAVALSASFIVGTAMFGGLMVLPLYWQIVQGFSPTESGLAMLPMVVGMMTGSILSGRVISRTGTIRGIPIAGAVGLVIGLFLLSLVNADTGIGWVMAAILVLGLGLGNSMQPLLLVMQSSVPPTQIGVATSSATFFRQIGGTLGVAVFLSILFATVSPNIADQVQAESRTDAWQQVVGDPDLDGIDAQVVDAFRTGGGGILDRVTDDSSIIGQMDPVLAEPFRQGFADSMQLVFRLAGGIAVLAFLILLLLPTVHLRDTSARVARASAPAD